MSDFSLMDAIECGIVKLPRVPVAENIPGDEMPMFRNLWENIRKDMPKKGRGKGEELDPLKLPTRLQTALEALYGHYEKTFELWAGQGHQGAALLHRRLPEHRDLEARLRLHLRLPAQERGRHDHARERPARAVPQLRRDHGNPLPRPNTLLIDSEQLEAGDALDDNFRGMAADEIERFRREIVERTGDARAGENITDQELLREVMNTVGKPGQLGGAIRCVVSVSMLTEGWDANTVTHVLGVRAFGTQLLCEQVIGRALRRQSYDLNEEGLFNVEYADVFGIPFDFTAKPVVAPPQPPRETIQVKAVRPERDALEIRFPRVEGYRVELPEERLTADFNDDSILELTPDLVGPSITRNAGIIGEGVDLSLEHLGDMRPSHAALPPHAAAALHEVARPRRGAEAPPVRPAQAHRQAVARHLPRLQGRHLSGAAHVPGAGRHGLQPHHGRRSRGSSSASGRSRRCSIRTIPTGSTAHVRFNTSKTDRWETEARRCHVNWVILDSDWEAEFCRVAEAHPRVRAYVKNHNLGLEVPYRYGSETRKYLPDFIVLVDDGHGAGRPAASRRRDQGLPARGCEGEESDDGHLLGAGREPSRHAMAAGPSPSSPRSIRSRPTSRPRSRASSTR